MKKKVYFYVIFLIFRIHFSLERKGMDFFENCKKKEHFGWKCSFLGSKRSFATV
jgi:hypothetical protein